MSMTKRVLFGEIKNTCVPTEDEIRRRKIEREEEVSAFVECVRPELCSWIKSFRGMTKKYAKEILYNGGRPSLNTFYKYVKEVGGLDNYLFIYFCNYFSRCLRLLMVKEGRFNEVIDIFGQSFRFPHNQNIVNKYIPDNTLIQSAKAYDIEKNRRKLFEENRIRQERIEQEKLAKRKETRINKFFDKMKNNYALFYKSNPEALYDVTLWQYEDYLKSPLWKFIRGMILHRDGHQCQICGQIAFEIHHRDYTKETLYGMKLDGLLTLCTHCHRSIEYDDEGNKITDMEVKEERLKARLESS